MRVSLLVCILSVVVTVLIDLCIFFMLRRQYRKRRVSGIYLLSSILCWMLLIVAVSIPRRGENDILPVMWMLYTVFTIYASKIVFLLLYSIGFLLGRRKKKWRKAGLFAGLTVGTLVFLTMWYGAFVTRNRIEVNRLEISSASIPDDFKGFRIVQISDMHTGTWGNDTTFVSTLVDSINALNPDVVLFTGDIVNRRHEELIPFVPVLSRIKSKSGVYSVLGNHDYGDYVDWKNTEVKRVNLDRLKALNKKAGWRLLDNEHIFIHRGNDSIAIIGVGNWGKPPFKTYGDLTGSYQALKDSNFKILLSHDPDHWEAEVSRRSNIDLTLSGHTHAMQFMICDWSPACYKYHDWGGLYQKKKGERNQYLYVNIGCGTVGMPARIGSAYPEITLLTLK